MGSRRDFLRVLIPGAAGLALTAGIAPAILRRREAAVDVPTAGPARAIFDVTDPSFGADPSGVSDSTRAIVRAAAALQAAGGGTLYFPRGTYRVYTQGVQRERPTQALAAFRALRAVSVEGDDAMISVEWRFKLEEYADIFEFTDCTGIRVRGVNGTVPPYYRYSIGEDLRGPRLIRLLGACRDVEVDARLTRFLAAVAATAPGLAADEPRTVGLRVNLDLKQCVYGLNCQFSGDQVTATIRADQIGRSYFVYGVRDHEVEIHSRNNNRDDCVLAGYRGLGLENIQVSYTNVGSTSALPAAAGVAIDAHWEGGPGERGCVFRNLNIHYHVEYPERGYPGHALHVRKYDPTGAYDETDRGHVFDGVVISGYVSGSPGGGESLPIRWDGRWGEGEVYRNWTLRDLTFERTSWADVNLTPLKANGLLQNVRSDNHIHLRGNASVPIRVVECRARSLSHSRQDRSRIDYVDSVITSDEYQSRINKQFIRTRVGGG